MEAQQQALQEQPASPGDVLESPEWKAGRRLVVIATRDETDYGQVLRLKSLKTGKTYDEERGLAHMRDLGWEIVDHIPLKIALSNLTVIEGGDAPKPAKKERSTNWCPGTRQDVGTTPRILTGEPFLKGKIPHDRFENWKSVHVLKDTRIECPVCHRPVRPQLTSKHGWVIWYHKAANGGNGNGHAD